MNQPPVTISDQIREMAPGSSLLVRKKTHNSIKAIASRIGKACGGTYITKPAGKTAVRVWRLK
jgi:hypothetical protein